VSTLCPPAFEIERLREIERETERERERERERGEGTAPQKLTAAGMSCCGRSKRSRQMEKRSSPAPTESS
jgi:hypothetical protein